MYEIKRSSGINQSCMVGGSPAMLLNAIMISASETVVRYSLVRIFKSNITSEMPSEIIHQGSRPESHKASCSNLIRGIYNEFC